MTQQDLVWRLRERYGEWAPSPAMISRIESGKTRDPDLAVLVAIADVLEVPLEEVSPVHAEVRDRLRETFVRSRCTAVA